MTKPEADRDGVVTPRWTDEHTILRELESLNDVSMAEARRYYELAREAAETEARHKTIRAKAFLRAKAAGARSADAATAEAEADPSVANAYLERLVAAALADACRESLRTIRNNQDGLRTAVASHRDAIAGPGWSGKR